MKELVDLIETLDGKQVRGSKNIDLSAFEIVQDSRKVNSKTIFIAINGTQIDGHNFLPQVCNALAVAVVVEDESKIPENYNGCVFVVPSTQLALSYIAKLFYSPDIENITMYAVTGTNGKTSTTYIIESILKAFNEKVGVLGTNNHRLGAKVWESELTTPGPIKLHSRLRELQSLGAESIAMEVSSHALDQRRVAAIKYDVALFTNLSRDHLNYHKTFDDYFKAKHKLFTKHLSADASCIINGDDPYAQKIKPSSDKVFLYGQGEANDFVFRIGSETYAGTQLTVTYQKKSWDFFSPLVGLHNAYNLVGALVALWSRGHTFDELKNAVKSLPMIPGRLESILNVHAYNIFIDYAHTDDALVKVLEVLKRIKDSLSLKSKLIVVFGCGGDRDKSKRPLMLKAAESLADICIVTSDNPRTEEPMAIINDITAASSSETTYIEVDRKLAINKAISLCNEDDILLIAGKGHEKYQIIGTEKKYFSDHDVVREALDAI